MTVWEGLTHVDVLIADDDALLRQSLRLFLEGAGYRCAEAGNGREAVELARREPPGCVLLDLAMPEVDGLTVARTLRADPRTRGAHIHCLTGLADPQARRQALEAGCERFLTKPVTPEALLEVVRGPAPAPRAGGRRRRPDPQETGAVTGLTRARAEELLDWLENQGCTQLDAALEGETITVRFACPPGLRLHTDAEGRVRLVKT